MRNWSTDTKRLKKNPDAYVVFKLEQMINFGLNGEKLPKDLLKKYWSQLNIDPSKKSYLRELL